MSIPGSASPLFFQTAAAAPAAPAYELAKSLRFRAAESNYLQKTPSSEGNRSTWTWSCWMKRADLSSSTFRFFSVIKTQSDNDTTALMIDHEGRLKIGGYNNIFRTSEAQFRDPSAWMHIVVNADLGQPTAADKFKAWVNGVSLDWTNTTVTPTSTGTNSTAVHTIGGEQDTSGSPYNFFDGYLAEIHFVDGAALSPTSFGALDSNGVWQAIDFTGSHNHDPSYGLSSSDIVSSTGFQSGEGADKVIDSIDPSSNRAHTVAGNAGETITVTFSPAVTVNTSLEIYAYLTVSGDNEERRARVNGGDWFNPTSTADAYHDLGFTGSLSTIQIQYNGSTNSRSMTMRGIRIDGNFVHTGTTGVNGFHLLDFENESTIGHDSSGSNFDYTAYNFSTTAGSGNDVLYDVPTNGTTTDTGVGGEVSSNYCVLNPLTSGYTLSNGNLEVVSGSGGNRLLGSIGVSSGKYYFEAVFNSHTSTNDSSYLVVRNEDGFEAGIRNRSADIQYFTSSGGNLGTYSSSNWSTSETHGFALDCDNNQLKIYKNNSLTATISLTANKTYFPGYYRDGSNGNFTFNFGQRPFAYTAPTGFKCLNTSSLPTPTIADGSDHFDVKLWTGNGSSQTISGLEFNPDITLIKARTGNAYPVFFDTVRGVNQRLAISPSGGAEADEGSNGVSAFGSNSFTVTDNSAGDYNVNGPAGGTYSGSSGGYVGWIWNAGSSTATNTDGSVTSSVRVNQSAGISIVSWVNGNNTSPTANTIGHGLNVIPHVVVTKSRDGTSDWAVKNESFSNPVRDELYLNKTNAIATAGVDLYYRTTSVLGFRETSIGGNGDEMIAFCFAAVKGFSAFGGPYTGTGTTNGPFQYCGFRPRLIIIKSSVNGATNNGNDWTIFDTLRAPYNETDAFLEANTTSSEYTGGQDQIDILSNGFKPRQGNTQTNHQSNQYIWFAFAENPFSANGGLAR